MRPQLHCLVLTPNCMIADMNMSQHALALVGSGWLWLALAGSGWFWLALAGSLDLAGYYNYHYYYHYFYNHNYY